MFKFYNMSWGLAYVLALVSLSFFSCNQGEKLVEYTKDMSYVIHASGTGDLPKEDMLAKIHFRMYKISEGKTDSLISESYAKNPSNPNGDPLAVPVKSAPGIDDILKNFRVGDSLSIYTPITKFMPPNQPLPPGIAATDKIKLTIKVIKFVTQEENQREMKAMQEAQQKQMMEEMEKSKAIDEEAIKAYLAKNNIKAERTEDGLYYIIENPGKGKQPVSGDNVKVHFEGRLMSDGSKFESSYDIGQPYETLIGMGRVIQGWDKGIPMLKEGGKATFIVPSSMGYGPMERPGIPPNSVLIFKVELVSVSKGSAQGATGGN
ncbi:MAG: hypothetical protein EAZ57_06910 [Cytophagales bacterium]|nr:MAG: hypothetical protein EAZ67_07625 [Cytophagales bacterium]TAF60586.1 MAG: hypothetical protein EAZ57_06910 [Cytophagales bacterium]